MRGISLSPRLFYVAAVSAAGLVLFAVIVGGTAGIEVIGQGIGVNWFIVACVIVGELFPISMPRRGEVETTTTSTAFSFALVLSSGAGVAIVAQGIAAMLAAVVRRSPVWKAGFATAQYTLSMAAGAAILGVLTDVPLERGVGFEGRDLPGIAAGAGVFFAIHWILVRITHVVNEGVSLKRALTRDLHFHASTTGVMLALSPVVVMMAERSVMLAFLVTLPIAAVYQSARVSLKNSQLAEILRDIADQNEYQALHDGLTGLPNRSLFHDRVEQAILTARREGDFLALMIMDLDRFKEINDALGHHNGDLLLQQIGGRLETVLRESDTVARLGGDEFAVLLPKLHHPAAATNAAEKIQEALEHPFELQGLTLSVGASIGIAFFPEHGADADTLIQRADVAMYVAKAAHTGCELYTTEQDHYSPRRLALIGELRGAIDDSALVLHYQPKADLNADSIVGVEALLRWQHPTFGLVPPDEFVHLAEHTGLIRPLTSYVLDKALRQCSLWHREGLNLSVAVNLSPQNLLDHQLPDEVAGLLSKWGASPAWLVLEITESSIMADPVRASSVLSRLHDMGVGLSIDDFGTGYSSLSR